MYCCPRYIESPNWALVTVVPDPLGQLKYILIKRLINIIYLNRTIIVLDVKNSLYIELGAHTKKSIAPLIGWRFVGGRFVGRRFVGGKFACRWFVGRRSSGLIRGVRLGADS